MLQTCYTPFLNKINIFSMLPLPGSGSSGSSSSILSEILGPIAHFSTNFSFCAGRFFSVTTVTRLLSKWLKPLLVLSNGYVTPFFKLHLLLHYCYILLRFCYSHCYRLLLHSILFIFNLLERINKKCNSKTVNSASRVKFSKIIIVCPNW